MLCIDIGIDMSLEQDKSTVMYDNDKTKKPKVTFKEDEESFVMI
jgi:hypothetical protein